MKIKLIDFGIKDSGLLGSRAHYNDAGFDVLAQESFDIKPGETKKVPLGFGIEIPDGYAGWIFPKSGLSSNRGLVTELSPIDSGYRGCIHAILHNQGNETQCINKGEKIGQLVIIPIVLPEFVFDLQNDRGEQGFGSTGV